MIEKIREYFLKHVTLAEKFDNILADFLGDEATSYSIEPVPVEPVLKPYTDGGSLRQYVFQFASKEFYDNSVAQNINNLEFYEEFQEEIETNNKNGVLPDIPGIQSIECTTHGVLDSEESGKAKYVIQMKITYVKEA
jgi:hypothetical protein